MRLQPARGGLRLPGHKQAAEQPMRVLPLADQLRIPLLQHRGDAAECCVTVGQQVRRGDLLGRAADGLSAPVHAPCDGEVLALETAELAHPARLCGLHVRLRVLGEGNPAALPPLDPTTIDGERARARIAAAGIVGLGGAGFPSAPKLAAGAATLILNGAECEPHIACDDRLLRERAAEVVAGARLLRTALGAQRVLLAVEDAMTAAHAALLAALAEMADIDLVQVPTLYPQGGERQLIRVLTGLEVPTGGQPAELGLRVLNVATAAAVYRAVCRGEPLTRRWISVSGSGVAAPAVFEAAIGTPLSALVAAAGGYRDDAARLLLGGPLMGLALPHDDFPVSKTSNALVVLSAADLADAAPELPCIRCGDCAAACPAGLLPQQLLQFGRGGDWERLRAHGLAACIECACCDLVCPSHIPLTQHFRYFKSELRQRDLAAAQADAARTRFESRSQRQQREQAERSARQAARRDAGAVSDAVQQALAKARAKRPATPPASKS